MTPEISKPLQADPRSDRDRDGNQTRIYAQPDPDGEQQHHQPSRRRVHRRHVLKGAFSARPGQ
ncbi:MAG: hypothetical protein R3D69_08705 [Xanthobacteraceae bacterium]